jgi:hypothetical protein
VILPDPLPFFAANAVMSGLPRSAFATVDSPPAPTRLMRSTFWWRAYFEGGTERPGSEAFRYFRLAAVQTEPQPSRMRSAVQIWQLVSIP